MKQDQTQIFNHYEDKTISSIESYLHILGKFLFMVIIVNSLMLKKNQSVNSFQVGDKFYS